MFKSYGTMTKFDLRNFERFEYYEATTETAEDSFHFNVFWFWFGTAITFYHLITLIGFFVPLTL